VEESVEYSQHTVFKGTYHHRIDPKGRLPIPAVFRRALGEGGGEARVVVTLLDQCLAIYPPGEWARLEAQLAALPAFNKQVKALTRLLTSRAADCEIDVQGRILLPPSLRQNAGLTRDAVVVGVLNRFEVWSPDAWDGFVRESERLLDDVSLDVQWPLAPPATPGGAPPGTGAAPDGGSPQSKPNS
jgi:MraZ protein